MGQRNTIQRQLVLQAVRSLDHPDAEEVYTTIFREHPNVSKGTVYRNLNILAAQGEISKIETGEGADKFDFCTRPHYHLRCRVCGKIFDADLPPLSPEKELGDTHGFVVERHNLEFIGICSECNKPGGNYNG